MIDDKNKMAGSERREDVGESRDELPASERDSYVQPTVDTLSRSERLTLLGTHTGCHGSETAVAPPCGVTG